MESKNSNSRVSYPPFRYNLLKTISVMLRNEASVPSIADSSFLSMTAYYG